MLLVFPVIHPVTNPLRLIVKEEAVVGNTNKSELRIISRAALDCNLNAVTPLSSIECRKRKNL